MRLPNQPPGKAPSLKTTHTSIMYATKRKLHNLLQAATSGSSNGGGGGSGNSRHKHTSSTDSTKSKLATVFRSKSTVNLPAKATDSRAGSAAPGSTGQSGAEEDKRPTTAGAVEGGAMSVESGATSVVGMEVDAADAAMGTTVIPRSPPTTTPDPKKRRTIHLPAAPPDVVHSHESWSIRTTTPSGSHTTAFSLSEKPTPAYAPWDRPQFLSRLKTFRFVDKWSAKPSAVNEVIWAKRGWVCVDKNRVRCTVCSREVVVKIDADDDGLFEDQDGDDIVMGDVEGMEGERLKRESRRRMQKEMVDRYRGMVITEHEDWCLWRRRGCDDTIYHLPLANPNHSIPNLRTRYASLVTIQNDLPPGIDYPTSIIDFSGIKHMVQLVHDPHQNTPTSSGTITTPRTEINESAFILALFGWANEEPSIPTLLTCAACFRRLGLWLFKHPKGGSIGDDDAMVCRLDVVGEHRDYCPWVNKESQGRDPGWKTLWKIVGLQMGVVGPERRVVDFYTTVSTSLLAKPVDDSPVGERSSETPGGVRTPEVSSVAAAKAAKAAAARARALSTPVPGDAVAVESVEEAVSAGKKVNRAEQTQKNESRLKRLKTVYFGGGKKKREDKDGRARSSSLIVGLGRKDAEKT